MQSIDCRGKACPLPVVMVKQALDRIADGEVTVIVDDPAARENVERFANSQGCAVTATSTGEGTYLQIRKGRGEASPLTADAPRESERRGLAPRERQSTVLYINSSLLGIGDEPLGAILMRSFLKTLLETENPNRMILINSGVKLACEGSDVLETLQQLSARGAAIQSCGTCLDYYHLKEKLKVGGVTNMYEIAETLLKADRVIRP